MLEWSLEGKGEENQGWTPSSCNGQLGWCKNYLGKQEKLLRSCGSCDGITAEEGMTKWWNTLFQWDNSSQPLPLSAECFLTSAYLPTPSPVPAFASIIFSFLLSLSFFLCSHPISWTESETEPVRCVECRKQEMKRFLINLWATVSQWIWQTI